MILRKVRIAALRNARPRQTCTPRQFPAKEFRRMPLAGDAANRIVRSIAGMPGRIAGSTGGVDDGVEWKDECAMGYNPGRLEAY
jgi:hypothetical protein